MNRILAAQTAPAALPSYFDGCAVLTGADASDAVGTKVEVASDTLGPEGYEAASCQYRSSSPKGLSGIDFRAFTKASVEGSGSDYSNDAGFQGDFPMDQTTAIDVPGVGDRARYGHPAGNPQIAAIQGVLTVVKGDLRFVVNATGEFADPAGLQQAATNLATRLLDRLAAAPPPPDPVPVPGSLKIPTPDYLFGDGRSLQVTTFSGSRNAVLDEMTGTTTSAGNVYFNGYVPPELDLRNVALSMHGADRIAVLEFAGPLTLRTIWRDTPVSHHMEVIFRPPTGGPGIAVAIQPDGSGAIINDPDGAANVTEPAPVVITGNWAALIVPASLGIGADWTASAVVRIESATPMPGGSNLTGWVLVTSPVSVGSLTGETTGSFAIGPPVVLNHSLRGASSATADLIATATVPVPAITSTKLDAANGHRLLTITFNRPLITSATGNSGGTAPGAPLDFNAVTVTLAPPGNSGSSTPITIRWNAGDGTAAAEQTATVAGPDGRSLGRIPVQLDGAVATLDMNALVPPPAPTTTTTSTTTTTIPPAPGSSAATSPTIVLGGPTRRFRLNVQLASDQCICDGGTAPGFDPHGFQKDTVSVVVSGEAIALTRTSTGSTAVGAIDPVTGRFQASNATEFWSGTIESGLDGVYAQIQPNGAKGLTQTLAHAQSTGGWTSLLDPLNAAANQAANGSGGGSGAQTPAHPCGPLQTFQVYAGHGVYKTVTQPAPYYLPNAADGFDQNQYASTYEYGKSLQGRWPPAGCVPDTTTAAANAPVDSGAPADTGAAPPVGTGAANLAGTTSNGPATQPSSGIGPAVQHAAPPQAQTPTEVQTATQDPVEAQRPLKLSDFSGEWTISVSTNVGFTNAQVPVNAMQFSPAVRADRLSPFSAAQATPTTTTVATTTAVAPSPSSPSPSVASSGAVATSSSPPTTAASPANSTLPAAPGKSPDSSNHAAIIIIIVIVVLLGAAIGFALWWRRKPRAEGPTDPPGG